MTKCSYCGERAVWTLFHRSGEETCICDKCERPEDVCSISKVGLEFKSDNWVYVSTEEDSTSGLDYSDSVTIKITKVKFDGEPTHWEYDLDSGAGGTGPTFYGVLDMAVEAITGDHGDFDSIHDDWVDFDANDRNENG